LRVLSPPPIRTQLQFSLTRFLCWAKKSFPSGNNQKPHQHLINDEKSTEEKSLFIKLFIINLFIDKKDKNQTRKSTEGERKKFNLYLINSRILINIPLLSFRVCLGFKSHLVFVIFHCALGKVHDRLMKDKSV
jgi:hypothetical protein